MVDFGSLKVLTILRPRFDQGLRLKVTEVMTDMLGWVRDDSLSDEVRWDVLKIILSAPQMLFSSDATMGGTMAGGPAVSISSVLNARALLFLEGRWQQLLEHCQHGDRTSRAREEARRDQPTVVDADGEGRALIPPGAASNWVKSGRIARVAKTAAELSRGPRGVVRRAHQKHTLRI